MVSYEQALGRALSSRTEKGQYRGWSEFEKVDPSIPVIIVFSHQGYSASSQIGRETRHIFRMADEFPNGSRRVRVVVRSSDKISGRVRQRVSPLHKIVTTREQQSDSKKRKGVNRRVFRKIAQKAQRVHGQMIVAIAPDAGQTPADSKTIVDPNKVNAGGVAVLLETFKDEGFENVPVIPIAFDHRTGAINIGPDCGNSFREASREEKPSVLAEAINSAHSSGQLT